MKAFKRILIGMDLSNTDLQLLDYLKALHPIQKPDKVYCTHVVKELDLPSFVLDKKGDVKLKPLDERLKKNLEDEVSLKLRPKQFDLSCDVLEGQVADQLLHWAEVKGADLTMLGRKKAKLGLGISAKRFLRKSPSSVLFVPYKKKHKIKRIVLATDFSKTSSYALLKLMDWIKGIPGEVKLNLVHVYDVPSGVLAQMGTLPERIILRIRKITKEFMDYYLSSFEIPKGTVDISLVENGHVNPGYFIYQKAKELEADLLVMGARGHSSLENFILGSTSEKVLDLNTNIPFLVLRPTSGELENIESFSIKNFKDIDYT